MKFRALHFEVSFGVALFFVAYVIQQLDPNMDALIIRAVIAYAFLVCAYSTLLFTMLPKIQSVIEGKGKRGTASRAKSGGSGSYSSTLKPEEILGAILTKYNALEKEQKIEMCVKHIEIWRNMLVDVEISEERTTGPGVSYLTH